MTKKSILAAVTVSALTLSQLGSVSADEVEVVDPTASSEIVVSEETTSQSSSDVTSPTVPSDTETPIIDDSGSSSTPSTGDNTGEVTVDDPTVPGTSEEEPSTPEPTETEEPETPSQPEEPTTDPTDQPGTVDVPTTDGGTSTVTPDTSIPTNNPNISAETAANAGASQVGTTSHVTGQVVQDVTSDAPVYTNTGATIISTQNSQVILADGTITSPESIGATTNSDGTISVTTATGESTTLPMTGDSNTTLLSLLGIALAAIGGFLFKKRQRFN